MVIKRTIVTLALCSYIPIAYPASFNCAKATTKTEVLICSSPEISNLDEQYSNLYKSVRQQSKPTPQLHERIQLDARVALRTREAQCNSTECLAFWYKEGLSRLSRQLTMAQYASTKPTPKALYEKLNLNTFSNVLSKNLAYYGDKYFTDYYTFSELTFNDNNLKIDSEDAYWSITILDENTLEIVHKVKQGSYFTGQIVSVYFNGTDFVSEDSTGGLYDFATQKFILGESANVHCQLFDFGAYPYTRSIFSDTNTKGEIHLGVKFPKTRMTLFDQPHGNAVGHMQLSSSANQIGTYDPDIRLCDHNDKVISTPPIFYRQKDDPLLLVFGYEGQWLNLSSNPAEPAWFNKASLPMSLQSMVFSREEVMLHGNVISVKRAHRLRTEPSTASETLLVIQPSNDFEITPLLIKGDWMKIRYTTPNPGSNDGADSEQTSAKPALSVMEGWLKWREGKTREYVSVSAYAD